MKTTGGTAAWIPALVCRLNRASVAVQAAQQPEAQEAIAGVLNALESARRELARDPLSAIVAADAAINGAIWCDAAGLLERAVLVRLRLAADSAP